MPNSVAEAYLLILRPSYVPVVGEAVPIPFNEQIEIDEWNWTMENEALVTRTAARDKARQALEDDDDGGGSGATKEFDSDAAKKLAQKVSETQRNARLTPAQKEKEIRRLMGLLTSQVGNDDKADAAEKTKQKKSKGKDTDEDKLKFTFKKNVDAATTQLLNSMKAGDVMPRAILTLFHRSTNAPVTLAIKFEKVRLKSYSLSVDPSETMADLKEEWTATYESVEYTYQNRPAASGPNGLTKGTVRVFKMKSGSLI
jgi:type VI protein secretion system component Hcp